MTQYSERDIQALDRQGNYYSRHVSAMTSEGLHDKSDIATELAWRDARIDALAAQVERLEGQLAEEISSRPEWAKGHSDESVAAQVFLSAKNQLWGLLGASNQTEAVQALSALPEAAYRNGYQDGYADRENDHEYDPDSAWEGTTHPSLARLKALWQAEAMESCENIAETSFMPYLGREEQVVLMDDILKIADELRRQAKGDQP